MGPLGFRAMVRKGGGQGWSEGAGKVCRGWNSGVFREVGIQRLTGGFELIPTMSVASKGGTLGV